MKKFLEEFKAFALRGNVMDMAVGVLIGGAFSGIVTSLTDNFIQPIINLVMNRKGLHIRGDLRICFCIRVFCCELPDHGIYFILSIKSNE